MNILGVSNLLSAANEVSTELSMAEKGIASAKVVLTGFVVVFAMLLLLILIIKVYSGIVSAAQDSAKKKKEAKLAAEAEKAKKAAPVAPKAPAQAVVPADNGGISEEVVAVISAAVATMYGSSEKVRIKSIKKSSGRSAWANAGILDNTRPF